MSLRKPNSDYLVNVFSKGYGIIQNKISTNENKERMMFLILKSSRITSFDQPPYHTDERIDCAMSSDSCFVAETVSRTQSSWLCVSILWPHSYCPFMESLSCETQIKFLKCLDKGEEQETVVEVIGRRIFVSYNKTLLNNSWNCSTREDA